jgi:hypothetical protein
MLDARATAIAGTTTANNPTKHRPALRAEVLRPVDRPVLPRKLLRDEAAEPTHRLPVHAALELRPQARHQVRGPRVRNPASQLERGRPRRECRPAGAKAEVQCDDRT